MNKYDEYTQSWFSEVVYENDTINNIYQWIAGHLPKKLVYFCYIRFLAFATSHGEGSGITPDEMTFSKAVEIWESYQ